MLAFVSIETGRPGTIIEDIFNYFECTDDICFDTQDGSRIQSILLLFEGAQVCTIRGFGFKLW